MTIYFIMYALTTFLFWCASKLRGGISYVAYAIGIFCPCFLAAVRDETIGTDLTGYGEIVYLNTQNIPLNYAIQQNDDNPIGFVTFAWLVNAFGGSFYIYLFLIELIIILPTLLAMVNFLGETAWIGMLVFLLTCYPTSLNIMKQMMATSILLLAFIAEIRGRIKTGLVLTIIAVLFHQTAIIGFLFYPSYCYFTRPGKYSIVRRIATYVIYLVILGVFFSFSSPIISRIAVFKQSYSYVEDQIGNGGFSIKYFLYFAMLILLSISEPGKWNAANNINGQRGESIQSDTNTSVSSFILFLSIAGCLFQETNVIGLGIARFALYFLPFIGLYIGIVYKQRTDTPSRVITYLFLGVIVVLEFLSIKAGNNEVYPYTSALLHIDG